MSKGGFFNPRSSENQLTKEKERGKRKSEKKERRRRRRKAIVALFVFIIVTLEFLAEKKNCWAQKVHLAIYRY